MKHSSLDYGYLRRWGLLLLLGLLLGGLSGLGSSVLKSNEEFIVSARFRVGLALDFTVVSDAEAIGQEAATSISTIATVLESLIDRPIEITEVSIHERNTTDRWKPTILGSIAGALLVILAIYVWEDLKLHERSRQQTGASDR